MTQRLSPEIKAQRAKERKEVLKKAKSERKQKLQSLITEHGSPYKAAKALGISPQAFYERMDHAGLSRKTPIFFIEKVAVKKIEAKNWFEGMLRKKPKWSEILEDPDNCYQIPNYGI